MPGHRAEGLRLLPRLVKPLPSGAGHVVWLLPTSGSRRAAFASRGSLWKIAALITYHGLDFFFSYDPFNADLIFLASE